MKSKILYSAMAIVVLYSCSMSQQLNTDVSKRGTTAAPFLSIGQGARALAMGSAFVAVADDQSAMYWNPAGIADLSGNRLLFDYTEWVADIKYNYLGATVNIGDFGVIGLNFTASSIADMNVTTVDNPEGT